MTDDPSAVSLYLDVEELLTLPWRLGTDPDINRAVIERMLAARDRVMAAAELGLAAADPVTALQTVLTALSQRGHYTPGMAVHVAALTKALGG